MLEVSTICILLDARRFFRVIRRVLASYGSKMVAAVCVEHTTSAIEGESQ